MERLGTYTVPTYRENLDLIQTSSSSMNQNITITDLVRFNTRCKPDYIELL